jgi:ACS family tartrate transporter-like MFS transporter
MCHASSQDVPPGDAALDRGRAKAYARLIPLLIACYAVAYIDRANVAIAKLQMEKVLPGFTNQVFGTGAGMFFLGYFLLEVPGSLLVERWSARKWLSRIMISWGLIAALQAFIATPTQFYVVRFFLGLAEAGFYPGVIVYLSHWFPARDRGRALSLFLIGTPLAQFINPKVSNWLLTIGSPEVGGAAHAPLGLVGWQWVFVGWALPAVVLGVVLIFLLPDRPKDARWLTLPEREALERAIATERAQRRASGHVSVLAALTHPKILLMSCAYLLAVAAFYGIEFFTPTILTRWYGLSRDHMTWLLLIPALASLVGILLAGWSSDRVRERRWHAAGPLVLAGASLALLPATRGSLSLTVLLFTLATVGIKGYLPAFWCLPTLLLTDLAAAGSTGFINAFGNLGGFLGPYAVGRLETLTGSFEGGLYCIAGAAVAAGAGVYALRIGARIRGPA